LWSLWIEEAEGITLVHFSCQLEVGVRSYEQFTVGRR
jgi:hypothetical protein